MVLLAVDFDVRMLLNFLNARKSCTPGAAKAQFAGGNHFCRQPPLQPQGDGLHTCHLGYCGRHFAGTRTEPQLARDLVKLPRTYRLCCPRFGGSIFSAPKLTISELAPPPHRGVQITALSGTEPSHWPASGSLRQDAKNALIYRQSERRPGIQLCQRHPAGRVPFSFCPQGTGLLRGIGLP